MNPAEKAMTDNRQKKLIIILKLLYCGNQIKLKNSIHFKEKRFKLENNRLLRKSIE